MAELIAKIGRFFAEQEAQIQQTISQAAQAPARLPPPSTRPQPPVHRIPTQLSAPSPAPKPPRSKALVRRLSLRSSAESTTVPRRPPDASNPQVADPVQYQSKAREVPPLPIPPPRRALPPEDVWSHRLSGELLSWGSGSSSSASTDRSGGSSSKDVELVSRTSSQCSERARKPRPPQQKHRKRPRKKKHGARSGNQEEEQPDPKELAKATAEKVAAALLVAQERAKRLHQERLRLERERELERQEAALRLQEQMLRLEAVRAKSFRQSSSCSSLSEPGSSSHETESVWTADSSETLEPRKASSPFMVALEAQLRGKMALEMHVKQSCLEKHTQRERVRLKLERVLGQNAAQSCRVARLAATQASLEMELAAVLEEAAQTRQERRELELADEKERLRRQREAERALQIRLREEEWGSMMEEEKARSQVAAEARVKASKRVEAHSAKLREMLQSYRYEPRHLPSSEESLSATSSNNNSDKESDAASARHSTGELRSKPPQPFKMDVFLPPELADFEEDGLCSERNGTPGNNDSSDEDEAFTWQVPSFPDKAKLTEVLLDMLSDDEEQ